MNYKKPKRYFEKSGVVDSGASYYVLLENVTNMDNQDIKTMVDVGRYFSIFALRQSGKTTFFEGFCHELEKDTSYVAILLSFQRYKNLDKPRFYQLIQKDLYNQLMNRLNAVSCRKLDAIRAYLDSHNLTDHISFSELFEELNHIIEFKKIVIFIDEFDGIPIDELENFLTTLRGVQYKKVTSLMIISLTIEQTDLMSNVEQGMSNVECRSLVPVLFGSAYACYKNRDQLCINDLRNLYQMAEFLPS
ncbi:MAG: hypothetical protein U9R02_14775, partial [Thermodesulfobacteriota bacterium]|nr:hypothetical protein [Thermodesulfobacteriota bacterium]